VIVHNVEHNREVVTVACIHQPFEPGGAAVGALHGKGMDTIVSPVALSRELRYGHQLDGSYSKVLQITQLRNNRVKCSFLRVSPHVDFVQDIFRQGQAEPARVFPGERGVAYLGRPVDSLRLVARRRIRAFIPVVQAVKIQTSRLHPVEDRLVITAFGFLQPLEPVLRMHEMQLDLPDQRRPHTEPAALLSEIHRP